MRNDLHCSTFDSSTLNIFKGAVNRWLLTRACFPTVSVKQVLVGLLRHFCKHRVFPTWAGVAHVNNNNGKRVGKSTLYTVNN